jgi:exonuclease III
MDNIKPTLTVSQNVKVNELVNSTNTQDLYKKTDYKINNLSDQHVHGANESRNNFDKTTSQNLSTKVPSKSKPKINLSHHLNGLVPLTIYHQNVRGLRGKANELLSQLYPNFPHILCLSEHHMNHLELQQTFFDNYKLGVSYCRTLHEKGGVYIFVQERYVKIALEKYCKDKDFEICAIKIHFNAKSACIIAIYRAPAANFDLFISKLDAILRKLYTVTTEYIICGDININYLVGSDTKSRLEALLKTYNLTSVVNFPTRIHKHSTTANDNIFIDISKMGNYSICPIINGLSHHDAQSTTLRSFNHRPPPKKCMLIKKIYEHTINDFLNKLSYETWDTIFSTDDVNKMFTSFLDSYLKICYSSFSLKRVHISIKKIGLL